MLISVQSTVHRNIFLAVLACPRAAVWLKMCVLLLTRHLSTIMKSDPECCVAVAGRQPQMAKEMP